MFLRVGAYLTKEKSNCPPHYFGAIFWWALAEAGGPTVRLLLYGIGNAR
jgi:hypothetical protein